MKATDKMTFDPSVYSASRTERLEFLKRAVGEFNTCDFGSPETGNTLTVDFGTAPRNGKPETYPKAGAHPRVLFNADDIPGIKAAFEAYSDSLFVKKFKALGAACRIYGGVKGYFVGCFHKGSPQLV